MNKIAIIDDQDSARLAVKSVIEDVLSNEDLEADWGVISSPPLTDVQAYSNFIDSENIAILLIDERLGESPDASGVVVNYRGSELVEQLRQNYKQLPIYGITAFPQDDSLETHFSQFDEIILRDTFTEKASSYIPRFIRAYQNFLIARDDRLSDLSKLSAKIAAGDASEDEINEAAEIQTKINLPNTVKDIESRSEWLKEYSSVLQQFEDLQKSAEEHTSSQEDNI